LNSLLQRFQEIRRRTETLTAPLQAEDYVVQPIVDVSPPKWHLGHTTWFFETFVLLPFSPSYTAFDAHFNYLFNSYYETIGARTLRTDRGNLTRPAVDRILHYRQVVNEKMVAFMQNETLNEEISGIIELGLQHEQQHQELLITDMKYILGHNPLFPVYEEKATLIDEHRTVVSRETINIEAGTYEIGFQGTGFCFDNELGRHRVFIEPCEIMGQVVTNQEYLEFMEDGGYTNFRFWFAEGWDWVQREQVKAPEYWHKIEGIWQHYTLEGLKQINPQAPLSHVSFYEAAAYADWKKMRLPTEFEWEVAAPKLEHGQRWEWTNSAYLPYPNYQRAEGAIGEYNGKFMVNQMVLRGGSCATSPAHLRSSYRNFFHPHLKWQYTGIRLAKNC
jgi:ergothioneine biosynthesis protein EgtB